MWKPTLGHQAQTFVAKPATSAHDGAKAMGFGAPTLPAWKFETDCRGYEMGLERDLLEGFWLRRRWFGRHNRRGGGKLQQVTDAESGWRLVAKIARTRERHGYQTIGGERFWAAPEQHAAWLAKHSGAATSAPITDPAPSPPATSFVRNPDSEAAQPHASQAYLFSTRNLGRGLPKKAATQPKSFVRQEKSPEQQVLF